MVQKTYGGSGKVLSEQYHDLRAEATFATFSVDREFGPIDTERASLEEITARRGAKRSTYITEDHVESEGGAKGGVDIRTVDDYRD
jgi:hypothetical protein